jgi:transcriptional regulator with XRE-family HTH domain
LTLQQVADRAGVSLPTLAAWETGRIHAPAVDKAMRIIDVLDIPVGEILEYYGVSRGEGVTV